MLPSLSGDRGAGMSEPARFQRIYQQQPEGKGKIAAGTVLKFAC